MLRSPSQGVLEHLDRLVIASLRQQQFPRPQPLIVSHRLLHIVQSLRELVDFGSNRLQASSGILALRLERHMVFLSPGYCVLEAIQTSQEDPEAPECQQEWQRGERQARDKPQQRCIAQPMCQGPQDS